MPLAYALFAFAVAAAAAGALLRRSLPALAAALVAFVAVRATVAVWLRPHYRTPITVTEAIPAGSGVNVGPDNPRNWVLGDGVSDAAGNNLNNLAAIMLDGKARDAGMDPTTYLHDQGIHRWVTYQPADRFWTFQLIETGIFVGAAAILLVLVIWRVNRRAF